MRHVFLINPTSGKKNISQLLRPQIAEAAEKLGLEAEVLETRYKGHGTELTRKLAQEAAERQEIVRVYACGGDGTFNEVMTGAQGQSWVQVGCVPHGSGNDFVRNFGSREDFLDVVEQMDGEAETIDMIKTNAGWSAAICAAGLDAQVAYGIPKYRRLPLCGGSVAYYLSIVEQLCGKIGQKLSINIDGEVIEGDDLLIAICNGRYYGGGFFAAPEASLDDGLLDIMIVKKISRLRIAGVLAIYKNGEHIKNGQVAENVADIIEFRRGKKITVRSMDDRLITMTLDGECSRQRELTAEVVENCATVVIPKKLAKKRVMAHV